MPARFHTCTLTHTHTHIHIHKHTHIQTHTQETYEGCANEFKDQFYNLRSQCQQLQYARVRAALVTLVLICTFRALSHTWQVSTPSTTFLTHANANASGYSVCRSVCFALDCILVQCEQECVFCDGLHLCAVCAGVCALRWIACWCSVCRSVCSALDCTCARTPLVCLGLFNRSIVERLA